MIDFEVPVETRMLVETVHRFVETDLQPLEEYASEMLGRCADRAVQIFGGMGFCKEMPIERIYRDCRVLRIYDGTSEIHRMLIARSLLKTHPTP